MNKEKKIILVNLLVICLYFIWPYFLNSFTSLFNLTEIVTLYTSFSLNFIFLIFIIHIYRKKLNEYINEIKNNFKSNLLFGIKVFLVGFIIYGLLNALLVTLDIPILNNQSSMKDIMDKIPIVFILNTLFYYPIVEELIFKMSFKNILKSKWIFVIITGFLNAFFQIVFSINGYSDLLYLLPYTIFFGALSYIYFKTDNIIYPIVIRICYNLIPCIIYIVNLFN